MEKRTFGGTFLGLLDTAGTLAIRERFSEQLSERSEGPTELANPATVTQPVNPSQFPGGQARHNTMSRFSASPMILAAGGVGLLVGGLVLARLLR